MVRFSASAQKSALAAVVAGALIAMMSAAPASAFWSKRNLEPFNPDVNAPQPYDRNSVGYGGTGGNGGSSSDCYWSREQIFIAGKLVWRPLLMCHYPSD